MSTYATQQNNFTLITHNSKTRIDRVYVPHIIANKITKVQYKNYIQSDHRAVLVKIKWMTISL